jgi:hypothetical protein
MEMAPLDGKTIILPGALDVYEGRLARAKNKVLERGNRQKVVFGEHDLSISFR